MILRFLSSATIGAAVTAGLLLLMNTLIEMTPGLVETTERPPGTLQFVRIEPKVEPPKTEPPEPIPDPVEPPKTRPPTENSGTTGTIGIPPTPPPAPPGPHNSGPMAGPDSGGLINIMKVYPSFPTHRAAQAGGYAIVRFDVNAMGQVENPAVIDSSHSVFNRSAINAILKFKYRPRIVNGEAVSTQGLKFKFTYEPAED